MIDALLRMVLKHFLWPFYFLFNALCCSPLLFGLWWLSQRLSGSPDLRLLYLLARVLLALIVGLLLWISFKMTAFTTDSGHSVGLSFKLAWLGAWQSLAFLPIVRHWFEGDETIPRPAEREDEE